jgi:hypothetical protein
VGVGGQHHALAALPSGKTRYPLYRRLGGPQEWSGQVWKISPPVGFDPRTVQPVASCYTDYAILTPYNTEACSHNNCCHGTAIYITYSECVSVLLVIQHAKCMRCIILSSTACLVLPNFSTLSHKKHAFWKNVIECNLCVLILSTIFVRNIFQSKKNWARCYYILHRSSCKVPVILARF